MTPKQKVLRKFPKAHAYLHGQYWHYVTQTRESGIVLGCATSRKGAWADAAQSSDVTGATDLADEGAPHSPSRNQGEGD